MHWILQENMFQESEWLNIIQTLEKLELPFSVHKVVPFVGELDPPVALDTTNVICMGSYSMRHFACQNGWYPGVFDLFEQNFEVQKQHWGELMLNFDSHVVPFALAKFEGTAFIRPIDDSKHFAGRLIDGDEMAVWQEKVVALGENQSNGLDANTLIQVSSNKKIFAEYRYWVVNGEIVTKSLYKQGNRVVYSPIVDERFDVFVNKAIAIWQPHDAFVIDVCDTSEGIKIVEINTINSAGFYAGDMSKLVVALEIFNAEQNATNKLRV